MDCEAFEASMIDELYGELDELTSAAMKRHASGCARCAALLDGLRATRKLAAVPMVDVPPALTDRILAVAQQQTSIPLGRRIARAVSVGGTWAMRPQSAMAAVFMVVFGMSLLLLRGRSPRAPTDAEVTVTEHGTPSPAARPVPQAMANEALPAPPGFYAPSAPAASAAPGSAVAQAPAARAAEPKGGASMGAGAAPMADQPFEEGRSAKAAARAARDDELGGVAAGPAAGGGGGGFAAPPPPAAAAAPAPYAANQSGASAESTSPFDAAVKLYESGRFDEATRAFEALAGQDVNADLYAARSIREGKGCRAAVARFDRVAQRAGSTPPGWDALLEGAICYRSIGDFASARVRLTRLLTVDSHKDRARAELDRLGDGPNQGAVVASPAAKARPAAPRAAAAAPAAGAASPPPPGGSP
jgi:hypothetical protein